MSETRTLFEHKEWAIIGTVTPDEGADHPRDDGDWATDDDVTAWLRGDWEYVYVSAKVLFRGVGLAEAGLGSVQHGVSAEWSADAWELTPGKMGGDVTQPGSHMWELIGEALSEAQEFVDALQTNTLDPLGLMLEWHTNPQAYAAQLREDLRSRAIDDMRH